MTDKMESKSQEPVYLEEVKLQEHGRMEEGKQPEEPGKMDKKSPWTSTHIAVVVISCMATALIVGLAVGLGVQSNQEECATVPAPSTTTTTIPTTPESTPTPTSAIPPVTTTEGPRECFTKLQHPLKGTGELPATNGEVWRATQCPLPGKPKCPDGVEPPVFLISLDGFRADYMLRKFTPNLQRMADCGAHAPYMRAAYPTKTFPNHYTLVTGLFPESHGIIDNSMFDMKLNEQFSLSSSNKFNPEWWGGEPIWNTVMKEGKRSATMFWPGSDTAIQYTRPDICYMYNGSVSYEQRVSEVLSFFEDGVEKNPQFVTLYFDEPDYVGHSGGPFDDKVNEMLVYVDNMIGKLMDGLVARNLDQCANVIVVADHGMTPVGCSSAYKIYLDDYHDSSEYYVYQGVHSRISSKYKRNSPTSLPPIIVEDPEPPESVVNRYMCTTYDNTKDWYAKFYRKQDLPKRYHFANNDRIDDVVIDIEEEYAVYRGSSGSSCLIGNHGYDNTFKSQHALFVAHGPAFKHQPAMQMFENIQVYNLIADLLHLENPVPNNGTQGRLHNILHNPPDLPSHPPPEGVYVECGFPATLAARNSRRDGSDCVCENLKNFTDESVDTVDLQLDLTSPEKHLSRMVNAPMGVPAIDWAGARICELVQNDYITGYSHQIKMPVWTAFKLDKRTGWSIYSHQYRTDDEDRSCVRVDVRLSSAEQTECKDFTDSSQGISHAFLYPPGFSQTNDKKLDAHISTNIVPMHDGFRKGIWRDTMILLEDYTEKYGELHVTLGPIFDYNADGLADTIEQIEANATFVGDRIVPIPTHFYVMASRVKPDGAVDPDNIEETLTKHHVMSIILPHKPAIANCMDRRIFNYQAENAARVNDIIQLTNLRIFPDLADTWERVRLLTYLPEELWERFGWMDLGGDDTCPDLSNVECPAGYNPDEPPLVLLSIDGFRPDYLDYKLSPVLERMSKCGVSTPYMRSVYPTLTFPNHYTQVTGLYPESHGIIDNSMYDMDLKEFFALGSSTSSNSEWWGGEPIWNTFLKENKTAMAMFWPGTDVKIEGMRPTVWHTYNTNYPEHLRISNTLDYLTGADGPKANLVTVYFSRVDSQGHEGGPGSLEVKEAVENMDNLMGQLMDEIYRSGLLKCVNIIVVSDHGMSDISCDRQSFLDNYMPSAFLNNMYVFEGGAGRISTKYHRSGSNYVHLDPEDQNDQQEVIDKLECVDPTFGIWHKGDLPIRNHYANNKRVDDLILRALDRYFVQRYNPYCPIIGYHEWDPITPTMKAYFGAYGIGFKSGLRTGPFENIELYNMLAYLGGVTPAPNNGTEGALYHILRHQPPLPEKSYAEYQSSLYPGSQELYEQRSNLTNVGCECTLPQSTVESYDQLLNLSLSEKEVVESIHLPIGSPGLLSGTMTEVTLLHHQDFVSGYRAELKMALWSAFTLTESQVSEPITDTIDCLRPDVRIEPDIQANCDEYKQGAPHNITNEFLFPSGIWKALVDQLVLWAKEFKSIQVFTGPVFNHNMDGRMDINITEFVGDTNIALPSHYYAVILKCPDTKCYLDGDYDMQAFVIPHRQNISNCMSTDEFLEDHIARVRDVELLTDIEFPPFTQVALRRKTFTPMKIWDQQRLG